LTSLRRWRRAAPSPEWRRFFPAQPDGLVSYVVHCSTRRSFLYVESAKVGCTSIKRFLQLAEVDGDEERLPRDVHDRDASPIPRLRQMDRGLADVMADPRIFKFAFVRNPYTRVLSAYLDKMVVNAYEKNRLAPKLGLDPTQEITLLDYLGALAVGDRLYGDIHWMPQVYLISPAHIPYDLIGRFEHFREGLEAVARRVAPELEHSLDRLRGEDHRTGAAAHVRELVNDREARLIRTLYAADFDAFAYGRDPRFAAL
jgi:hypothetical protein